MPGEHSLNLGHGLTMHCSMDSLDDTFLARVTWHRLPVGKQRFSRKRKQDTLKLRLPFLRVEVGLWVDVFAGEVTGEAEVAVRPLVGRWRKLLDLDHRALVRFDPAVGEIGGEADFVEPVVRHDRFGASQLCTPAILRLHVDDGEREISDAGRIVKRELFPDHPPFVFNTIACVGQAGAEGRGLYGDPNSIWFNVFFGCYQIDAPRKEWSRPFGYCSADGAASQIKFDDVSRLGEADWNFFSNWMYGVPMDAIRPYMGVDPVTTTQQAGPDLIGTTLWHGAAVEGVTCVSTYQSNGRGAGRLVTNSLIDDVWRRAFGLPNPQPNRLESFVPTTLRAEFHMAYSEDDDAYHTVICGGTATLPVEQEFLAAQMEAIRKVIADGYGDRGFPQPAAASASP